MKKKIAFILTAILLNGIVSAQFAGINNIVYHESQGTAHEWLTWSRALNDFAHRIFK